MAPTTSQGPTLLQLNQAKNASASHQCSSCQCHCSQQHSEDCGPGAVGALMSCATCRGPDLGLGPEKVRREIQLLARLSHVNIVELKQVSELQKSWFGAVGQLPVLSRCCEAAKGQRRPKASGWSCNASPSEGASCADGFTAIRLTPWRCCPCPLV